LQAGSPEEVSVAMQNFIKDHESALKDHKPENVGSREWNLSVSNWLHKTSHITVSYGLQYDGVEIERLSLGEMDSFPASCATTTGGTEL
jgi:hypothetical protein